jgi:malate permease and related proteins
MADTLFQAYMPLLIWTGLGLFLFRFVPDTFPRFLGRSLYWVGVPIQIFTLARQTNFSGSVGLAPFFTVMALLGGLALAWGCLQILRRRAAQASNASQTDANAAANASLSDTWSSTARRGSFVLSSMIGNTGFIGLAIAPPFVDPNYFGWIVFYSITQNVIGTYGIGVFLASYYGRSHQGNHWLVQLRDVLTVPSLWAFILGYATHTLELPASIDVGLRASLWLIIPSALLLMGMRIRQLHGWKSLKLGLMSAILKVLIMPTFVGIAALALHLPAEPRLALVLMSGMPSAFAGLILAEEYNLDRELIASSIVVSTVLLLVAIPMWVLLFGDRLPLPLELT